jgi:acyl-CoA thioesterase I
MKWLAFLALAASLWASEGERRSILILGDSLAAGSGVDLDEAFPALLQKKIHDAGLKYEIVNAGVSGDTTAGGLRRIDWLLRRKVDILVLELGGNDGLRGISPATTRTNLQLIIDRTKAKCPDARIVIAGMQMPPNMGDEYNNAFREVFPDLAKSNKAALIPFLLEGVGGKAEMNLPDQIHPNPEGHRIVAENAWQVLKPLLSPAVSAQ